MTEQPSKICKSEITQPVSTPYLSITQPRNSKQVENIQLKQLKKQRLSHDALYNVHELAHDLPEFVHSIRTYPDLVCVFGQKALLSELDRVLLLESSSPQLLSYDTTFQLGDFYISVLSFHQTRFKEASTIPAAFLLHERKFEEHHKEVLNICCKLVQSLRTATYPIVTDKE